MNEILWGGTLNSNKEGLYTSFDSEDLFRDRNEIWFSCNISSKSINKIIKMIHEIIHDDKVSAYRDKDEYLDIIIHIDSNGGHVAAVFKFIDCIEQLKKKKIRFRTIINGRAYSASTLMAIVGDIRHMTKHSFAMIHEIQCASSGYHTHVRSYLRYIDTLHSQIINVYNTYRTSKKEGLEDITLEQIEKWMSQETWFDAEDYLKLGFVDEII